MQMIKTTKDETLSKVKSELDRKYGEGNWPPEELVRAEIFICLLNAEGGLEDGFIRVAPRKNPKDIRYVPIERYVVNKDNLNIEDFPKVELPCSLQL